MSAEIALFPLSQIVLPGGRMPLRIFEPRYQRLVREASVRPFASALLNPYVRSQHESRIFPLVTEVKIVDFCQLEDGLLGITIEGVRRLEIMQRWQEDDGLHVARCEERPMWPATLGQNEDLLAQHLQQVFAQNPELEALYPQPRWYDSCWLAQRWLEILTMPAPLKYQLISALDASAAIEALQQWLQSPDRQPHPFS